MSKNTITKYILTNTTINQSWDLMNGSNIKVLRDHIYEYTSQNTAYPLENGVYYSKNEDMAVTTIPMTAHLNKSNDYSFKRFINNFYNTFRLDITLNGVDYYIYGKIGNSKSEIDWGVKKDYVFDFDMETRPLSIIGFGGHNEVIEGGKYNEGAYNAMVYGSRHSSTSIISALFSGFNDVNSYFTVTGVGAGLPITINVNGYTMNINTIPYGTQFKYSNIPTKLEVSINGVTDINLTSPSNASNFLFNLQKSQNNIEVVGLLDGVLEVWKGYKVV